MAAGNDPKGKDCAVRLAAIAPLLANSSTILIEPKKLQVEEVLKELWKCPGDKCAQYLTDIGGKRCGLCR